MTPVRRILGIPLVLFVAVIAQVAVVDRAPLPFGAGPDLVLLAVAGVGTILGPVPGMTVGFIGGLLADVTPPASHLAGEYALVFCLAGYACGRMRDVVDPMEEQATIASMTVLAVGAAGGEAAKAALGLMLSDPDVSAAAVAHVLPGAILYDVLLSPFALWTVALAVRRPARPNAPNPHRTRPRTAGQYGAVRPGSAGSAPRLRLSGGPSALGARTTARPEPRLKLGGGVSPALSRTASRDSASSRGFTAPGRKPASVNFSSSSGWSGLVGGGSLGGGLGPSLFSGKPSRGGPAGSPGLGKGWLKGAPSASVPSRGIAGPGPGKGWLKAPKPGAAKAPRAGGGPGKGWLRPARPVKAPRRSSPGKGWLKGSRGALGKRTYQSRATPSFRRRRGIRLGGRR